MPDVFHLAIADHGNVMLVPKRLSQIVDYAIGVLNSNIIQFLKVWIEGHKIIKCIGVVKIEITLFSN